MRDSGGGANARAGVRATVVAVLAVGALAVSAWLVEGTESSSQVKEDASRMQGDGALPPPTKRPEGGVPPRAVEPATRDVFVAPDVSDRTVVERAAREAADLEAAVEEGDVRWIETLEDLFATEAEVDAFLDCAQTFLEVPCTFALRLVISPDGHGRGRVSYAAVDGPTACSGYVRCMAEAYVGREVRLPEDLRGAVGHRFERTDAPPRLDDPEGLRTIATLLELDVAEAEDAAWGAGRPEWAYLVAQQRMQAILYRRLLEIAETP